MKEKMLKLVSAVTVMCILAGILMPNFVKSAQAVVSNVSNTWHGIGNTGVFTVKVNGYSNLYCANGGAPLNNGTVLNDNGLSMYNENAASNVTTSPKAVSWILDNIYLTEGTDSDMQSAMKRRLKSTIRTYSEKKDSSGKSILCSKIGVNSIDDNWINTAVESLINDSTTLFATQQYALWHYIKNNNSAYNNAMQNSDGTYSAIPNAKIDKKYYTALYISLTGMADQAQSNGYNSPNVNPNGNIAIVNDGAVKVTIQSGGKTALIGPYKLENNNPSFTKSFSATVNSEKADNIETVDANGNAVNVSAKKDGFFVKVTYNKGFVKGTKYNFNINVRVKGYKTFATLLTSTNGSQPIISIKKEAVNTSSTAEASCFEELSGNYSLELEKVDSKNPNTKIKGVTFKVKEGNNAEKNYGPTDSNGLVSVFKNKAITQEGIAEYTITEVDVGNNEYIKLKDQVKFYITLSKTNSAYVASKVSFSREKEETTRELYLQDNSKVNVTAVLYGNTVKITIPNKPNVKGKYSLILEKVDSTNPNKKLQGVTFKVKEENNDAKAYGPTDSNGLVTVVNNKEVKEQGVKEYTITEINVGSNKYIKLKDEVKVYITISESNNQLSVTKVSFDKDKENKTKILTLDDNSKVNVTAALSGSKVVITVPNKPNPEGKYSLVLEKVNSKNPNKKISGVKFKVKEGNGEAKTYGPTGVDGTVTVFEDKDVTKAGLYGYTITEIDVGNNKYIKIKDEINVYIKIAEVNNKFVATKVSFNQQAELKNRNVKLEDGTNVNVTARIENGKVIITIPNKPNPEGKYSLILEKVDSKEPNKKISGVKFKVKEGTGEAKAYGPTGEDGTITVFENKNVTKAGLYNYTITEVDVGDNEYIKIKDEIKVYIKIEEVNNKLVATTVSFNQQVERKNKEVALEDGTKVNVTARIENDKVIVTIPNQKELKGKYSLELEKVDSDDQNKKLEGVTFKVKEGNNTTKSYGPTNSNGIVSIVKNKEVKQAGTKEYTISEINVGKNKYITLKDAIKVYIKITKTENAYIPSKVSFDKDQDKATKEVELKDGTKVTLKSQIKGNTVKVTIPNKKAVFDLALRKYITKVNNIDLPNSREPIIRLKDASALLKNGTALYNNPKDPVKVKEGNTVTYKIRIYNEGNVAGYAKEITDYLPNGLEFVENSEINKANGWITVKNEDGTTTVKTTKLANTEIKASNGAEGYKKLASGANKTDDNWVDFWQEVEIECKVKSNLEKQQKIVNVAEITNYGYMDGDSYIKAENKGIDRDSEQDNVFNDKSQNQKNIDEYYENQYNKKNNNTVQQNDNKDNNQINNNNNDNKDNNQTDNNSKDNRENNQTDDNNKDNNKENQSENKDNTVSKNDDKLDNYPGIQDDDDFENLIVEPDSNEFKFVLNKVDEKGNPLIGADFTVRREKDSKNEVLLNNQEVKGTYEVLESQVKVNKTYTYRVIEVESAPEYVNVMEGKYITLKVYMNQKKELVIGNYEKVEEEDYLLNKYGFIINNENGTIVKENETDLYEKIKVKVNNEVSPAKVEITIPNEKEPKDFDLALRKFITEIRTDVGSKNEQKREITNRVPVFKVDEKGNYTYEHTKEPIMVVNDNVVVYTLRVYNEGEVDGYAKEIKDDIPEGLEFLPLYELNKEYKWKMLDKYGKEVTDIENAVTIVSDYLSKEQEEVAGENLIKAFDIEKYKAGEIKEPYYREVKVAFKVKTDPKSEEIIINKAQISDDSDSEGNEVEDKDSTPDKWIEGEDDQDIEKVKLQYFDLSLRKWVTKAIVIEDGKETVTETGHNAEDDPEDIVKVDLNKSKISDVTVKFEYSIRVKNEGKIAGFVKEISDYIPEGLRFVKEDNPNWEEADGKVVTSILEDTLLQPGDMAEVKIILTWINAENNMGLKQNVAEISKDYNEYGTPDIDSTPNNKVPGEDDIDDAPVMLTIKTGQGATYVGVIFVTLVVLAGGIIIAKKCIVK